MNTENKFSRVYLDYAATTPLDPRVINEMEHYFLEYFGNPSSIHWTGQKAEGCLEEARVKLASMINAKPNEVIFTGSGTESDNLGLRGIAFSRKKIINADVIITTPVEHPAILNTARQLASEHHFIHREVHVDQYGLVDPSHLDNMIDSRTAVVAIIYANNEIGTINPIHELAKICSSKNIPLLTDAIQAAAHLPINVEEDPVQLLTMGSHKFYGPKGVGALYIRSGTNLVPSITGGGQEFGWRPGTQNLPLIQGFVKAYDLIKTESELWLTRIQGFRDRIISEVLSKFEDAKLTGHPQKRLPNHASFVFRHLDGNKLVMILDSMGFACSSGSACKSGNPRPSEVLVAIGIKPEYSMGSLRVTLGRMTTEKDIDAFLKALPKAVHLCRMTDLS